MFIHPSEMKFFLAFLHVSQGFLSYSAPSQPTFFALDLGAILLRCLAETAIVFIYLASKASDEEFGSFVQYAEGKEKLLMLHLQERFKDERAPDGRRADDIADELGGGFAPELLEIELHNWTKKNMRELANAGEVPDLYQLIFDPTSAYVHGNWHSLRSVNLKRSAQILHRHYRVPSLKDPPGQLNTAFAAEKLFLRCLEVAQKTLDYPELHRPFVTIPLPLLSGKPT